jgi:hypothetical protein
MAAQSNDNQNELLLSQHRIPERQKAGKQTSRIPERQTGRQAGKQNDKLQKDKQAGKQVELQKDYPSATLPRSGSL